MTNFDEREKGFESKFAHEEEIAFKINARRNKLLGLWAAEKLGKTGEEASEYAKDIVLVDFESAGDGDVIGKLVKDFQSAGLSISEEEVNKEIGRLFPLAREQITGQKD